MGFFDSLVSGAKAANKALRTFNEEAKEYYEEYQFLTYEELIEKYKKARKMSEKGAICKIMKENGWSRDFSD